MVKVALGSQEDNSATPEGDLNNNVKNADPEGPGAGLGVGGGGAVGLVGEIQSVLECGLGSLGEDRLPP